MPLNFSVGNSLLGASTFQARRRKFGVGSLLTLLVIGIVFIGAGWVFYKSTLIDPSWKRANGTVVGANTDNSGSGTTYSAIVRYNVNGQTYQVSSGSGSSAYPRNGTTQQVAYDPQAPADAKVVTAGTDKLFIFLFMGIGGVMVVIAPIAFVRSVRRSEDIRDLTRTGQKVTGILVDIQEAASGGMQQGNHFGNNVSNTSYRLVVSATGPSGTVENFVSDSLTGIGGLAMADFRNNPIPIDVYINPANPKDYYVDVSEVPSLTPDRIAQLIQSAAHLGRPTSVTPGSTPPIVPGTPMPPSAGPTFGTTPPTENPPSSPFPPAQQT